MNYRMTVWTNRTQILDRVQLVTLANFRKENEMMNVNEPVADLTECFSKTEPANETTSAIVRDARLTCAGITFV